MRRLVFAAHAWSTLAMTGVIWIVQVVHYPLFALVGPDGFAAYAAAHQDAIALVVLPLMALEALGAALLVLGQRPANVRAGEAGLGLALLAGTWVSTWFVQVPLHESLARGFDLAAIESLVLGNWLRTGLWSARSGLVALWIARGGAGDQRNPCW
ncbi:MAG: hypothetical protein IT458_20370 [Planctomycetes bacterium]|nr:hypothetical protein [Planctomycetota bacterium]